VHPNPNVKGPAEEILGGLPNVHLVEPMDYPDLVASLKQSYLVLTDSGGLQEEAPALGKPVLVFRNSTERPEAVEAGGVLLVGSDPEFFLIELNRLWDNEAYYASMAQVRFPYGDGFSAQRIATILGSALQS
jgi:UDP-N-acetylglucosamine 2-epimerase (non-hydrolysing)